ncbi:hypothetical protein FRB91_011032 [Serendipita sp. 411]|nr:hypothetical protein FRB91_011032 [Serendipita sp. 411]
MCPGRLTIHSKVAIKVIRAIGGVQSGTLKKRLSREMDVWWKLEHPNIVPLLGYVDGFGPLHSPISPVSEYVWVNCIT